MNKKNKIIIWIISLLFLFWLVYFLYSFSSTSTNTKVKTIAADNLDQKTQSITKKEYLEKQWITDFSDDYKKFKEDYKKELSTAPSSTEVYVYLWLDERSKLNGQLTDQVVYQEVHTQVSYEKLKSVWSQISQEKLYSISNKLELTSLQLKRLESLQLKRYDLILVTYLKDYNTWERTVSSIIKWKDLYYHFEEMSISDVMKSLEWNNDFISLVWLFEKKYKKEKIKELVDQIAIKSRCNLRETNKTKKYIHEDYNLELFDQTSCDRVVVWYFQWVDKKIISRIYVDSFYSQDEKETYLKNYQTVQIETNWDETIWDKMYYEMNKKFPLIFF